MDRAGTNTETSAHERSPTHLAFELGDDIDGAWWPHTSSVARELPDLIDALRQPLGDIVDISVNWSPLDGAPDLNALNHRGNAAVRCGNPPSTRHDHHRQSRARDSWSCRVRPHSARRHVAASSRRWRLLGMHQDTHAFRTAEDIVLAARAEHPIFARLASGSA